jgi:hypothetical protein
MLKGYTMRWQFLCPLAVLMLAMASTAAHADEDLYKILREPLFRAAPNSTDFSEFVVKRQVEFSNQQVRRFVTEMYEPGLITRDIPTPFTTSLRSQSSYYQVTGVDPSR